MLLSNGWLISRRLGCRRREGPGGNTRDDIERDTFFLFLFTHLIDGANQFLFGDDDVFQRRARFVKIFQFPGQRVDACGMRHRLDELARLFVTWARAGRQKITKQIQK